MIAMEPVVPRMAAALERFHPSVSRIVAIVMPVAVRTASGTGGTPLTRRGSRIRTITTIVRPSARSARTPCQPPTTTTAAANRMTRTSIGKTRQRSLTEATGPRPSWSSVIVTTTASPGL
jgi:hypothetical protein